MLSIIIPFLPACKEIVAKNNTSVRDRTWDLSTFRASVLSFSITEACGDIYRNKSRTVIIIKRTHVRRAYFKQ